MYKLAICTLCFFVFYYNADAVSKNFYTLDDLLILSKEKSVDEFLEHAKDVLPKERNELWQKAVKDIAVLKLDRLLLLNIFDKKSFELVEELTSWPILNNYDVFLAKRESFAKKYLINCFENRLTDRNLCHRDLLFFWNNSTSNLSRNELGIYLAELLIKYLPTVDRFVLIHPSINASLSNLYCQKEVVWKTLYSHVQRYLNLDISNEQLQKRLYNMASSECYKAFEKELKSAMFRPQLKQIEAYYAYKTLSALNLLTRKEKDIYLTTFILSGPVKGEIFNEAWNTITELGKNYDRRKAVLMELKNFDPLPDHILSMINKDKDEVLVDLIHQNIPEYLDFYSRTCEAYLTGKKEFPKGNPTVECRKFLKHSQGKKWVDASVLEKLKLSL